MLTLFLAQPVPAFSCAMHGEAGSDAHAQASLDEGSGMDHQMGQGMDHDRVHDTAQKPAKHDCCESGDSGADTCNSTDCLGGVVTAAFSAPALIMAVAPGTTQTEQHKDQLASSHDLHPYRPPKLFS